MKPTLQEYKLPKNWSWTTIGELTIISSGGTPDRKNLNYYKGEIPWVKSGELNFNVITDTEEKISELAINNSSAKIFPKEAILVALYGATVGKLAILGIEAASNQAVAGLITTKSLSNKYVYYYLQQNRDKLLKQRKGGAQPNISQNILSSFPIPVPNLQEQHDIVNKIEESFDNLNNTVNDFKQLKKQLSIYREIILKQAYNGKLSQKWRIENKFPNSDYLVDQIYNERVNRFNEEIENWKNLKKQNNSEFKILSKPFFPKKIEFNPDLILPDSWSQEAIGNLCKKIDTVNSKIQDENRIFKYIDIGAISKFRIDTYKEYKWKNLPSRARQIIKLNDTLFSTVRTYLKNIAYVDKQHLDNEVGSSGFVILRPEKLIHPKFLFYYSISGEFINKLNKLQSGTSYPAIRDNDLLEQSFPVCSFEEQQQIVDSIESQFSLIENLQQTIDENIAKANILRQSILKLAFEGNLVSQSTDDTNIEDLILNIKNEKKAYLEELKKQVKLFPKNTIMKEKQKTVLQILGSSKTSLSAGELWKLSIFKDDIEAFYEELKRIQDQIQEEEKGILSLKK